MKFMIKKTFLIFFSVFFCFFLFCQEVLVYDESIENKKNYSALIKSYLMNDDIADCSEYALRSKQFYSIEGFSIENCAYEVTEAVIYKNYYKKDILDKEYVKILDENSFKYLQEFKKTATNFFKFNKNEYIKNKKFVALSKAMNLFEKYEKNNFTEQDFVALLWKPDLLYAIFNNSKFFLQTDFTDQMYSVFLRYFDKAENDESRLDFKNHENFIIFPSECYEFYSSLSFDMIDEQCLNYYNFSRLLKEVYELSILKCVNLDKYFLQEDFAVINEILHDGFYVFMISPECVSYFVDRLQAIITIEKDI
ncbi:MAG: hypothetical protein ACTTHG_04865 [Treponemataceae bacterium]